MKLLTSLLSPFGRKVHVTAIECGLEQHLEVTNVNVRDPNSTVPSFNPLGKIPVLILDNNEALFDSAVICEYLDSISNRPKLFPTNGEKRWEQLKLHALSDGIMDAVVQIFVENNIRPEAVRWTEWTPRQLNVIQRSMDVLENCVEGWGDEFLIGQITSAVALGVVQRRQLVKFGPKTARWMEKVGERKSMRETAPAPQ